MLERRTQSKIIASLLGFVIALTPMYALAETSNGKVTNLKKGDTAPFDGILFDSKSAARLVAEKDYEETDCRLRIKYEIEKVQAYHAMELAACKTGADSLQERHTSLLDIRDQEITRLQKLALRDPNDNANWWFTGGAVAGVLTSIAIFYAAVETSR